MIVLTICNKKKFTKMQRKPALDNMIKNITIDLAIKSILLLAIHLMNLKPET